jgi:phospholipid transport system substrate-binding protein
VTRDNGPQLSRSDKSLFLLLKGGNMKPRAFYAQSILLIAALILVNSAQAVDTPPDQLVKTTTEEVLAVIKENQDQDKLLKLAETKVLPHFNFHRMTKLALGKSWKQASPEQQKRLESEFRNLLVRTYTNALATGAHKNVTVDVKPLRKEGSDSETTVQTQVTEAGRQPISIEYRMEKVQDGWKVYDVAVDGVSLVTNYRQSFVNEIQQSGIDGLIKSLTEKNRARSVSKG